MTQIAVVSTYYATTAGTVELPEGKTWGDIERYYVRWGALCYQIGDKWYETQIETDSPEVDDWKQPACTAIYAAEDGEIDWGEPL